MPSLINSLESEIEDLDEINLFGISIGNVQGLDDQRHIGLLYTDYQKKIKFLHFAWEMSLKNEDPYTNYAAFDVQLESYEKTNLSMFCELVYEENKDTIQYNILFDDSYFDNQGIFTKKHDYSGLTCATFVLKVFEQFGYFLIDYDSWAITEENKTWQKKFFGYLLKLINPTRKKNERLILEKIDAGAPRFKPEEVAAAATLPLDDTPYQQETIQPRVQKILEKITKKSCSLI